MNSTLEMRELDAAEIDSVIGAGGFSLPSINVIINPQVNAGIIAAISVFGNVEALNIQNNTGLNAIQSRLHL